MSEIRFDATHDAEWTALDAAVRKRKTEGAAPAREVPRRFRRAVAELALARDRQYRTSLIDRLHSLVVAAHLAVHGARARGREAILPALWNFIVADFPREVRREWA